MPTSITLEQAKTMLDVRRTAAEYAAVAGGRIIQDYLLSKTRPLFYIDQGRVQETASRPTVSRAEFTDAEMDTIVDALTAASYWAEVAPDVFEIADKAEALAKERLREMDALSARLTHAWVGPENKQRRAEMALEAAEVRIKELEAVAADRLEAANRYLEEARQARAALRVEKALVRMATNQIANNDAIATKLERGVITRNEAMAAISTPAGHKYSASDFQRLRDDFRGDPSSGMVDWSIYAEALDAAIAYRNIEKGFEMYYPKTPDIGLIGGGPAGGT